MTILVIFFYFKNIRGDLNILFMLLYFNIHNGDFKIFILVSAIVYYYCTLQRLCDLLNDEHSGTLGSQHLIIWYSFFFIIDYTAR